VAGIPQPQVSRHPADGDVGLQPGGGIVAAGEQARIPPGKGGQSQMGVGPPEQRRVGGDQLFHQTNMRPG
jgi:hypothetical protein